MRILPPPAWTLDALCAETDPEVFFPERSGSTREAKGVCSRCLVSAECLDAALDFGERFGVWGGLTERERRQLLREMGRDFAPLGGDDDDPEVAA